MMSDGRHNKPKEKNRKKTNKKKKKKLKKNPGKVYHKRPKFEKGV